VREYACRRKQQPAAAGNTCATIKAHRARGAGAWSASRGRSARRRRQTGACTFGSAAHAPLTLLPHTQRSGSASKVHTRDVSLGGT
jgi:hypothetical protein